MPAWWPEPEAVAMSGPNRISLRESGSVRLAAGTADLFLIGTDGRRWPLITVAGPIEMVGPKSGDVDLVAVGRIDAELTTTNEAPPSIAGWVSALQAQFPEQLQGLGEDVASVRESLTDFCSSRLDQLEQIDAERERQSEELDKALIETTRQLLAEGVRNAGEVGGALERVSADQLISVLTLLGDYQGFEVPLTRVPESAGSNPIDSTCAVLGIRNRKVALSDGWQDVTRTALLGIYNGDDGPEPVALIPGRRGYRIQHAGDLQSERLTTQDIERLAPVAIELYVPLPRHRPATFGDMGRLALRGTTRLWVLIVSCAVAVALLALATPALTSSVVNILIPEGSSSSLVVVGIGLVVLAISSGLFNLVQNFATSELTQLGQLRVESALWDRTLSLPLRFFRQYSSGDLVTRLMSVDQLKNLLSSQTVTAILGAVFSLVNFVLLFTYDISLAIVAAVLVGISVAVIGRVMLRTTRLADEQLTAQRGSTAWTVQLITGIGKIRVAGAEDRLTALTMTIQSRMINAQAKQTVLMGGFQAYVGALAALAPMLFFLLIGTTMWSTDGVTISTGTYIAFATAFNTILGAVVGLTAAVPAIAMINPTLKLIQPILEATQIQGPDAPALPEIRGEIELRNVAFQYQESTPMVLRDLSIKIEPGKLTAIVGPSGSGKTSTLRMITGVEAPDAGQILIDGHDLRDIDGDDYRRRIGTVIQGGQLSAGSVLENIAGGAQITEDQAWAAAKAAAIADDIEAMDMKMETVVGPQVISGGQAQRILIARALARNPRILLFDEATSALDNLSQKTVMDAMASMEATRVIVAHRLSTVMGADTILVVADGRLVEQGDYDSLMKLDGVFAELARRQLASDPPVASS